MEMTMNELIKTMREESCCTMVFIFDKDNVGRPPRELDSTKYDYRLEDGTMYVKEV